MREAFGFQDVKNLKLLREKVKDRLASLNPEEREEIEMKVGEKMVEYGVTPQNELL